MVIVLLISIINKYFEKLSKNLYTLRKENGNLKKNIVEKMSKFL